MDAARIGSGEERAARLFALIAPVLVVGAAYALWWISDRLLYVGPLDRAQFGWLVVVPTLLAAPVVAGVAWAGLDERPAIGAAAGRPRRRSA